MIDPDQLSSLPSLHTRANSLVCALHDAACTLGIHCSIAEILVVTGWGITCIAAEEWFDPATLLWHPMMVEREIPALTQEQADGLARLSRLGLTCRDAWFHHTETDALVDYVLRHNDDQHVVVLWGVSGPGYTLIDHATATHLTPRASTESIPYDAINARGGIHCIVVSRHTYVHKVDYQHYLRDALIYSNRIEFATPTHPLRPTQTWHIGIAAWDVMAYVAQQAAPLSLVSTHVSQIIHDYAWRYAHLQAFLLQKQEETIPPGTYLRLVGDIDDCCFYVGILHKQYAHIQHHTALTIADGALIAQVCGEIASTLRNMRQTVVEN